MKWIGQNIENFISRFQQKVYIESGNMEIRNVSGQPTLELSAWSEQNSFRHAGRIKFLKSGTATLDTYTAGNHTTSGEILGRIEAYGVDDGDGETLSSYIEFANDAVSDADSSPGKIVFATSDADDAGTPTVRLTIDDDGLSTFVGAVSVGGNLTFDSVGLTAIQTSAESYSDSDTTLMTSAAIDDRIATLVTAEDLDVAGDSGTAAVDLNSQSLTVTGGTGITTSATGQAVTINVDAAQSGVTSLGTLTALQVDYINANGSTLTITDSTDTGDYCSIATTTHGATTITTVDDDAAAADFEIAADGDIILDAAGDIYHETGTVYFTSSTSNKPILNIKNFVNDEVGPRLRFTKDKGGAGLDGDDIGTIEFVADDAAQTLTHFASIVAEVSEADDTDEAGKLTLKVAESDGTTTALSPGLILEGEHATDGQVDATIGNGSASTTTVAGDLSVTTGLILDSVDVTTIQTSSESFADNDTSLMTSAAVDDKIITKYASSIIVCHGQANMLASGNWVFAGASGITNHTWNIDGGVDSETNASTTASIAKQYSHAGIRVPFACVLDGFYGGIRNAGGNRQVTVGLFCSRAADSGSLPPWGTTNATEPILQCHADANNESGSYTNRPTHIEVSGADIALAVGDMIYPAMKLTGVTSGGDTDAVYCSVNIHLKTLIS